MGIVLTCRQIENDQRFSAEEHHGQAGVLKCWVQMSGRKREQKDYLDLFCNHLRDKCKSLDLETLEKKNKQIQEIFRR